MFGATCGLILLADFLEAHGYVHLYLLGHKSRLDEK
jgi:hypothetical protein